MQKKYILIFAYILLLISCRKYSKPIEMVDISEFREGDLVLRCGWGMQSRAVSESSRSVFSHIGILHFDTLQNEWCVVHAVPGEVEKGTPEYLKCEPLTIFLSRERARRGAWMRIDCSEEEAQQATQYALRKVAEKIVFDNKYLLSDTTELFCTELIWQSFMHQGIDVSGGKRHIVPTIFCKDGETIYPCDIENGGKTLFVKPLNIYL